MKNETLTRSELVFHLTKGHAHMNFQEVVANFPKDNMNRIFPNGDYTFWHLLEHIRRTQNDILDFIINSDYQELEWPKDYWPEKRKKASKKDWETTIQLFLKDQQKLQDMVKDEKID